MKTIKPRFISAVMSLLLIILVSCSYKKPDNYAFMEESRAKDSITYLYAFHVTYGSRLIVKYDSVLFTAAEGAKPLRSFKKGERIFVDDFFTETVQDPEKGKVLQTWVVVRSENNLEEKGTLPAYQCTYLTDPANWTRFIPEIESGDVIIFLFALIIWIPYIITLSVQRRRHCKEVRLLEGEDAYVPKLNSFLSATILYFIVAALGVIWTAILWKDSRNSLMTHYYFNPGGGNHPWIIIFLLIFAVLTLVSFIIMVVEIIKKKKLPAALWHILGCTPLRLFVFFCWLWRHPLLWR